MQIKILGENFSAKFVFVKLNTALLKQLIYERVQ